MTNVTYVRWQRDELRRCRVFPPLTQGHPSEHAPCALCDRPLGDGHDVQLVAVGPDDDEGRQLHAAGRWYTALAACMHASCVDSLDGQALAELVTGLTRLDPS